MQLICNDRLTLKLYHDAMKTSYPSLRPPDPQTLPYSFSLILQLAFRDSDLPAHQWRLSFIYSLALHHDFEYFLAL